MCYFDIATSQLLLTFLNEHWIDSALHVEDSASNSYYDFQSAQLLSIINFKSCARILDFKSGVRMLAMSIVFILLNIINVIKRCGMIWNTECYNSSVPS